MNIAEVSKKFGLTADTLRYYERIGLLPAEFIKCMREAGLSIEVLTRYMHLFLEGDSTLKEREELLIAERDRLENRLQHMQETLSRLNHKIELYEQGAFRSNNMGCECI